MEKGTKMTAVPKDYVDMPPPKSRKKTDQPKKAWRKRLERVVVATLCMVGVFTIATPFISDWAIQSEVDNTLSDMGTFSLIYSQYGEVVSETNQPLLMSANQALFTMLEKGVPLSAQPSAMRDLPWRGSSIFLLGKKQRVLISSVSRDACLRIAREHNSPVREAGNIKEGLSVIVAHAGEKPGCYKQYWKGDISSLYSSLNYGVGPEGIVTYTIFQALPTPEKRYSQI